jgi:hypothetical protein
MEQALEGNVGRFTLPEIFQLISQGRKTGTLGIQRDDDIVMVYFENGRIIYGYGPRQTYHLGQLLRERGRITAEQLEDAVGTQSKNDTTKRLGQILIEKGFINRVDLEKVVKEQVEELIYSILAWDDGTFKFYENQHPTQEEITVSISAENAILEGYRRIDELNRVKEALPDFDNVLAIALAPVERRKDVSLQSEEWNLLALVNGRRTVNDIVDISNLPRIETLQKLATLKLAGLITVSGKQAQEETDRLAVTADRVGRLLEEYLRHKTARDVVEKTTVQSVGEPENSRLEKSRLSGDRLGEDN